MKVTLLAAITLNGKIATSEDQLIEWTSKDDKRHFVAKTKEAGVVIMGRKTFETFGGRHLPGRLNVVLTRSPRMSENREVRYTDLPPIKLLEQLSSEGYEHVVIGGGGEVYTQFLDSNLVDEIYLTIAPFLFNGGVDLVGQLTREHLKFKLDNVEKLNDQEVLLKYIKFQ